jgi:hypothetical protein
LRTHTVECLPQVPDPAVAVPPFNPGPWSRYTRSC